MPRQAQTILKPADGRAEPEAHDTPIWPNPAGPATKPCSSNGIPRANDCKSGYGCHNKITDRLHGEA
jgi:hypothetical protein